MLDPAEIRWERYPFIAQDFVARRWLETQVLLGLAPNTVDAYGRAVEDFLAYCGQNGIQAPQASRDEIARYVGDLRRRPSTRGQNVLRLDSGVGLSNATLQQRLTAVRLFFDYLIEEGLRETNPVGRGRYTPGKAFGGRADRGLLPRFKKLPWIPSDEQWLAFLQAAKQEPIRNRCMIGLAYDAGLRREELCSLRSDDIDPAHRTLRIRAETTKGKRERVVPYSASSGELLKAYLAHRHDLAQSRGPLFLSESRRNKASPITLWTWSKVVRAIADRADLPQFSTHTLRHLCLTDLARAGWDLHEIAAFAGHRNPETTQQYIHLSGRDLARKLAQGMAQIHARRAESLREALLKSEAPV
ncbi:MAG: tyrosine-type recombinase/integrase [Actinomycetota bacterium]|nr:tyrosine-type recombinase/integrase [Actinomycetota bacterium]